jgi:choline kinase
MRMIVLAAGQGKRLRPLTDDRPKALVPFLGRPLLDWTLTAARENGLSDIIVVGGYKSERLARPEIQLVDNVAYASTTMVGSLMVAEPWFGTEFVMSYGDIAYRPEVLRTVLASTAEIGVVVDLDWQAYWERRFGDPLRDAESLRMAPDGTIRSIGRTVDRVEDVQGQYIGLVVFRGRGVKALRRAWVRAKTDASYRRPILGHRNGLDQLAMTDVLDDLTTGDVPIMAIPIHGGWVEIDTPEDIVAGEERWSVAASPPRLVEPAPAESKVAETGAGDPGASGLASAGPSEVGVFRVRPGHHPTLRW